MTDDRHKADDADREKKRLEQEEVKREAMKEKPLRLSQYEAVSKAFRNSPTEINRVCLAASMRTLNVLDMKICGFQEWEINVNDRLVWQGE